MQAEMPGHCLRHALRDEELLFQTPLKMIEGSSDEESPPLSLRALVVAFTRRLSAAIIVRGLCTLTASDNPKICRGADPRNR